MTKFALNFGYIGCCVFKTVPVKLILRHLQDINDFNEQIPQQFFLFFDTDKPKKGVNNQISTPISTFDDLSK